MSGSLLIKAKDLSVGDVLLLPMGRTATIERVRTTRNFVYFKTEYGSSRVEVDNEVFVKAQVLS